MINRLKQLFDRQRLLILVGLVIIAYGAFSTLSIMGRNYKLQQQVDTLQSQIELLELQNQQLEYQIAYYSTDAFVEKEARDKLDLQAPGEHVVIFPNKIPGRAEVKLSPTQAEAAQPFVKRSQTNFQHWLYFLFRIQPKQT